MEDIAQNILLARSAIPPVGVYASKKKTPTKVRVDIEVFSDTKVSKSA